MESLLVPPKYKDTLLAAIHHFEEWFRYNLLGLLEREGLESRGVTRRPNEWMDLEQQLERFEAQVKSGATSAADVYISGEILPLLKRTVIMYRRSEALRIEGLKDKTHHPEILKNLDGELETLQGIVDEAWFRDTVPLQLPRGTDVVPIQRFQELAGGSFRQTDRQYDEKFHILQAPELFLPDLQAFRHEADLRNSCTTVAFVDIDHFKRFNSEYSETTIDRAMLPRFMQLIESHVWSHGFAYRQGGDEYLILIPGLSRALSIEFLDELRQKVAALEYPGIAAKATVSIGVCTADVDCFLTDRELQERANIAKKHAKGTDSEEADKTGRNRIAAYVGSSYRESDIQIVRPKLSH
jgi:diguanylate cyclase (GGDEF)-like protein